MKVFIDIETLPVTEPQLVAEFKQRVKPPGNITKPESRDRWLDNPDNIENAIRKTSFDGAWGQLLCIGIADEGGPIDVLTGTESEILTAFLQRARSPRADGAFNHHKLVGHNVRNFDIPFINKRMLINGFGPLYDFSMKPWERPSLCTGTLFSNDPRQMPSLDTLCAVFNVPTPKTGINGADVYDRYLAGDQAVIFEYCKRDVEATRALFWKMTNTQAGAA